MIGFGCVIGFGRKFGFPLLSFIISPSPSSFPFYLAAPRIPIEKPEAKASRRRKCKKSWKMKWNTSGRSGWLWIGRLPFSSSLPGLRRIDGSGLWIEGGKGGKGREGKRWKANAAMPILQSIEWISTELTDFGRPTWIYKMELFFLNYRFSNTMYSKRFAFLIFMKF